MTGVLIRGCRLPDGSLGDVYVKDGRIAKIGSVSSGHEAEGSQVIDANGGSLLPGLIDSHCHPFEYGWLKRNIDLRGTSNITGLRLRLSSGIQRAVQGEWVTGMGWDQESFPEKRLPAAADIDDISASNPVSLTRVCGHIALLNSRAMELLGLSARGGPEYDRDGAGRLTGIVREAALTEVYAALPRTAGQAAADLQSVEAEAGRLGLTTLHCIVSPEGYREELSALALLDSEGTLGLRYKVYVPPEALEYVEAEGLRARLSGGRVRLSGVKIYADGSLGARTAALREPYADDPKNLGMLRQSDSELQGMVEKADEKGMQVIVHAIGDRAVEQAVEALASVAGASNPLRHRIEHASLVPRDLRAKMAKHSLRATVQPLFITSDTWATERLGEERVRDLYPLRSLLEAGVVTSGSSDCPVESLSPVLGIWASMTRGASTVSESLSLEQAISLYTASAASNGVDGGWGLSEGGAANLTLLDSDIEGIHPALLRKVGVLATVVEGSLVHSFGA